MTDEARLRALPPDAELLAQCLEAADGAVDAALDDLCGRHPERAAALRRLHALLAEFGLAEEPAEAAEDEVPTARLPERIGPYRVLELLGTGGMGLVYLAEHQQLGRRVALKVIHGGIAQTPKARQRFEREAVVAAQLEHWGICPVYEAGESDGVPFIAMRYVAGRTLAQAIHEQRRRSGAVGPVALPPRDGDDPLSALLRFVEDAGRALHVAHEAGLVHRDVKPANLMVTPEGAPVLLDFGLARVTDSSDAALTRTGDEIGTPYAMAPEQLGGAEVDRRADVYGLGVTLYEALVLEPPFQAALHHELAAQILREDPPDPRRSQRHVGRELWTVLQTAMAKEPDRRYATALAFAEDLRRLRSHQPVLARRAGPLLRLRRLTQRHPVTTAFVALLVVALLAFAVLAVELQGALRRSEANERALRATATIRVAPAVALEEALAAVEDEPTLETISALYEAFAAHHERLRLVHGYATWRAAFTHDGEHLLTCSGDGSANVWDRSAHLVASHLHDATVSSIDLAPPGVGPLAGRFATASQDGTARVFGAGGEPLLVLDHTDTDTEGNRTIVNEVRFSPDGAFLATVTRDGRIWLWDAATGARIGAPIRGHRHLALALDLSRGGLLATADDWQNRVPDVHEFAVRIWSTSREGLELRETLPVPASVHQVDFAPDGSALVAACHDGAVYLWELNASSGRAVAEPIRLMHGEPAWTAQFSPENGDRIVTGGDDGTARLWSREGERLGSARHGGGVVRARWFGGTVREGPPRIVTTSVDTTVRVFDAQLNPLRVLRGHADLTCVVDLSPDGRQLASSSFDNTVRVWGLVDPDLPRLMGHTSAVRALARLTDGTVVSAADDGTVRVWDPATAGDRVLPIGSGPRALEVAADGRHALLGDRASQVRWIELASGELAWPAPFVVPGAQWSVACLLRDGRVLAIGRTPKWYVLRDGAVIDTWEGADGTIAVDAAPGRGLVAAGGRRFTIDVWDDGGTRYGEFEVPAWAHSLAWSPEEDRLAVGLHEGRVVVSDVPAHEGEPERITRELTGHDGTVFAVAWSPDSRLLAAGVSDGTVHLWRTADWTRIAVLRGHDGAAVHALLFAGENRLLSGAADGAIQTWTTSVEELVRLARTRVARVVDLATAAGR